MQNELKRMVPEHLQAGLLRWIEHGVLPGHFMQAVLNNDLRQAINRGDDASINGLQKIVQFLHNYAPEGCLDLKTWKGTNHGLDTVP